MLIYRAPNPTNKDGLKVLTCMKLHLYTFISRHQMCLTNSFSFKSKLFTQSLSYTHKVKETKTERKPPMVSPVNRCPINGNSFDPDINKILQLLNDKKKRKKKSTFHSHLANF